MFEFLKTLLQSDPGSFGFVFALIVFIGWLIFYVTKHLTKINTNHDNLSSENTKTVTKLEAFCDKHDKYMDEIRRDIVYLKGSFDIYSKNSDPLAKSHSPVSLTEKGYKVAEEIEAEDIIIRNWENIINKLDSEVLDKNAYDIQTYCIEMASVEPEIFFTQSDITKIKHFAFQNGQSIQYYGPVFGILIRDKYFNYKGINPDEIDKNDPNPKQ